MTSLEPRPDMPGRAVTDPCQLLVQMVATALGNPNIAKIFHTDVQRYVMSGPLSGALHEGAAGCRQPLTPSNAGNTTILSLPGISGTHSSLSGRDYRMATPKPFTFAFGNMASEDDDIVVQNVIFLF
ncbi:hypothetical protein B0H19DRAFT_1071212 [Mycena capillaripes]|nr:hypothetical protein B0H19DRAFT_1071212 [Mycena capillaripes]